MKYALTAALILSFTAFAADPVVCTVTTSTGTAASTASCTSGSATWQKGAFVLMQCTTDTYTSSVTGAGTQVVTPASSSSEAVDFTNNKDKVGIPLGTSEMHISVLAVTSAGTCKFMLTQRKNPTK